MGGGGGPSAPLLLLLLLLPLVAAADDVLDGDLEGSTDAPLIDESATTTSSPDGAEDDVDEDVAEAGDAGHSEQSAATPTASTARKCCPPGLSMYRVIAPGCDNQVTCKIADGHAASTMWSLQPGGPGQYGFPTACPRERCRLVLLDGRRVTEPEPFCVDKLVETDPSGQAVGHVMAGMACRQRAASQEDSNSMMTHLARLQSPSPAVPVVPFRKCCAVHQVYDLATRLCVDAHELTFAGDGDDGTPPPPADYEKQRRAVSSLLARVLDKKLAALVDMSVGFPDCEQSESQGEERRGEYAHTALLDVAVFDLPWDDRLMDEQGVVTVRPAALGVAADEDARPPITLRPGAHCVDDASVAGTLVVKACLDERAAQREAVCARYGCFRKCCPHDKYFTPAGQTHVCVPRPAPPDGQPLRPQVHDPPSLPAHNLSDVDAYAARSARDLVDDAARRFVLRQQPQQVTFSAIVRDVCPGFRFRLEDADVWFLDRLGTLYQPGWPEETTTNYCIDESTELNNLTAVLVCMAQEDPTQESENWRITLITAGLLTSCLFLALTLATYCCLPALQNLHGKTLMCHVSSLLVAYLFLALTQMLTKTIFLDNVWVCSIIGNCVLFTFLSAFSWLNVMCFDIWRTFGCMTSSRTLMRSSASRRFRWYCVYAWGLPSLVTAVCVLVDQWPGNDKSVFRPQMGDGSCWFRTEPYGEAYGIHIFFTGPLLVQTCSNLMFFVLTVRNYARIKSEINRLHNPSNSRKVKKFQADANKLKMNVKLFVVMGVTWLLEIVSTFLPREHAAFYASDMANALQGVFIFFIFVVKRKVLVALGVRLGRAPPRPAFSANASVRADGRLGAALSYGLAARGKAASTNTLFTSEFRSSAVSTRAAEALQ